MGVGLHVFGQVIVATVANFEVSFAGSTIGEVWTFTASMAPLKFELAGILELGKVLGLFCCWCVG